MDAEKRQQKKRIVSINKYELLDPKLLVDPDNYFFEFQGVEIHQKFYKIESHSLYSKNVKRTSLF